MASPRILPKTEDNVVSVRGPEMMMVLYEFSWFGPNVESRDS